MTICPCCGCKVEGDLFAGCAACGARAVGPPLARPEHILPSYGPALLVGGLAGAMVLIFSISAVTALAERVSVFSASMWDLVAAAETAAWRLKWLALPVATIALWAGGRAAATVRRRPASFVGQRIVYSGFATIVLVTVMFAASIGVTIPDRLRQRQMSIEAGQRAPIHTIHRVFLEYNARYGSFPTSARDLEALPDPDGSVAVARAYLYRCDYRPIADVAVSLAPVKSRRLRSARLRAVSVSSNMDDGPDEGISFTRYKLIWPGEDKVLGTADDLEVQDGVIVGPSKASDTANPATQNDPTTP